MDYQKSQRITQKEQRVRISPEATNFFVYGNDIFEFKIYYFKKYSNYFLNTQKYNESNNYISLVDELEWKEKIPSKVIYDFINFVQENEITLNAENIPILNYLAKRFEVDLLKRNIEQFIQNDSDNFPLQFIIIHQNEINFKSEIYENAISDQLLNYINCDGLLCLNFPILYRILMHHNNQQNVTDDRIIGFYFTCLGKYGKQASILFNYVDFSGPRIGYLKQLISQYSNVFDFNFLNKPLAGITYELLMKNEELIIKQKNQEEQIDFLKNCLNKMELRISQIENQQLQQLQKNESKYEEIKNELDLKILEIKNQYSNEIKELNKKIDDMKKNEIDNIKKYKNENDELKKSINIIKDSIVFDYSIKILNICHLDENLSISIFNQFDPKLQISIFKQLDSDFQISIFKLLDQKLQISIFDQLDINLQFHLFKQLDEKLQIPIFNQSNHKFKHCPLIEGKRFDGIIKYLTDKEGGKNIHDCGKIAVTSDYTIDKNIIHSPKNVVSFNLHGCFFSNDDINASIVFDFKEMKINIEHYSIKSIYSGGEFGCHMKNWVVEVSDDGVNN